MVGLETDRQLHGEQMRTASVAIWPAAAARPARSRYSSFAFDDFHVSVVDCPAVMVVGDAEIVAVLLSRMEATG
jgi:hypothetical protein